MEMSRYSIQTLDKRKITKAFLKYILNFSGEFLKEQLGATEKRLQEKTRDSTKQIFIYPVSEFNEFEPRLKSAKNRFQLSAGLNLENLNTIFSATNFI